MSENNLPVDPQQQPQVQPDFNFGPEIEIEGGGFSFQPIIGFDLQVDGSVYMYSDDGKLEVSLVGGYLSGENSIADLNKTLASDFMENFDSFKLTESGTDTIQGVTGFLNQIEFVANGEEGLGCAMICSPHLNQYFFILVISSADHWQNNGQAVYEALKSRIQFYREYSKKENPGPVDKHPDLTIETFPGLAIEEDFLLEIEKKDTSLLLAAHSSNPNDLISLTGLTAPDGQSLYSYLPNEGSIESRLGSHLFQGSSGEMCLFFPRDNTVGLHAGTYRFSFSTQSGMPLEDIQVIIRTGRALEKQAFDLNLWIAVDDASFNQEEQINSFIAELLTALTNQLSSLNLVPGKVEVFHAAPDELDAFTSLSAETDLADCSYMIAETVNNSRALNIGFVEKLTAKDGTPLSVVSTGDPGMILSRTTPHGCMIAAWPAFEGNVPRLAEALLEQLVVFCGIDLEGTGQVEGQPLALNREIAWRLRRHPLFYDAD